MTACFCSAECKNKHRRNVKLYPCKECGVEVGRTPSDIKKAVNVFCSSSCSAKFYNRDRIVSNKCLYCGKDYHPYRGSSIMKYCSCKCSAQHKRDIIYKKIDDGEYKINVPFNDVLRKYLSFRRGRKCEECNLSTWKSEKIPLTVHHKDGNALNNIPTNLQLLCWNCHALTKNYGRKNKTSARTTRYKKILEPCLGNNPRSSDYQSEALSLS